jgi:hypothetical protein
MAWVQGVAGNGWGEEAGGNAMGGEKTPLERSELGCADVSSSKKMLARGEREINQLLFKFVCYRFAFGFSGPLVYPLNLPIIRDLRYIPFSDTPSF